MEIKKVSKKTETCRGQVRETGMSWSTDRNMPTITKAIRSLQKAYNVFELQEELCYFTEQHFKLLLFSNEIGHSFKLETKFSLGHPNLLISKTTV